MTPLLGARIAQVRQWRGVTRKALADQVGISFEALRKIEKGLVKSPSFAHVQAIAVALDVSLDLLGSATMRLTISAD